MKTSDFDFCLPEELIAQKHAEPRDASRLLVLNKKNGKTSHDYFYNLLDYLKKGDTLIVNNSKVIPARLIGKKASGGAVEIFLNHQLENSLWEVLGRKVKVGQKIIFPGSKLTAQIIDKKDGIYLVEFNLQGEKFFSEIEKIGHTPLPPYIKRTDNKEDKKEYQTVYAKDKGSAAAPTAGLHFTDELFEKLKENGVEILEITLHVGLGTFLPVKSEELEDYQIHSEYYSVKKEVYEKILEAKNENRRIISVGTTTTRVLEHVFQSPKSKVLSFELFGWTKIFIYPGYKFRCIDGLITNFHLPKSSLLMLVSAFASKESIDEAYSEAIKEKYHFFSYGDAMLII